MYICTRNRPIINKKAMKKLFAVVMAVAAISFMSCGNKTEKAGCEDSCARKCDTCVNVQKCDTCADCHKCDTCVNAHKCGTCVKETAPCASSEQCIGCPKKGE